MRIDMSLPLDIWILINKLKFCYHVLIAMSFQTHMTCFLYALLVSILDKSVC